MATLYYAEHTHTTETQTRIPTPYFCTGQESESESVPESISGNVNEPLQQVKRYNKEAIFGFMQSCSCLSCRISCSTAPGVTCMCTSSAHRLHVIHTLSACYLRMRICCPHQDTSSVHCLQAICTTPHGHRGPELSFTVTGICY